MKGKLLIEDLVFAPSHREQNLQFFVLRGGGVVEAKLGAFITSKPSELEFWLLNLFTIIYTSSEESTINMRELIFDQSAERFEAFLAELLHLCNVISEV